MKQLPILCLGIVLILSSACSKQTMNSQKQESTKVIVDPPIWNSAKEVKDNCDEHIAKAQKIRTILSKKQEQHTVQNTLELFNEMLVQIDTVMPISSLHANTHPNKEVRTEAEKCEQAGQRFLTEIQLDKNLYNAVASVDINNADTLTQRFAEKLLRDYRRAGVDKDQETRDRIAKLKEEMVKTGQDFSRNIREGKLSISVSKKDLAGLPEDYIKNHKPGKDGKITITTDYPDFFPLESYASSSKVREQLYKVFLKRAYPENEKLLKQLLALRYEYATILGHDSWASYNAEDKMAKDSQTIDTFIKKVAAIARPRMENDLKDILARKKQDEPKAKVVETWDRFYYVNKIQNERFGVDSQEVRQYFNYPNVKQGVLDVAQELFGLTFKRNTEASVWHPKVEAYDIIENGKQIARFYLDMHPREGKYSHAAEFGMLSGIPGKQLPSASLVCNFPDPEKGNGVALMEHNDVVTFFHEFGHLMHQLLAGRHHWVTMTGINCEWDFVEAPSQLLEEWPWTYSVLARFAKHYKTNAVIPKSLVEKMKQADEFGKGVHVMRQMFYAALSYTLHNQNPKNLNLKKTMLEVQKEYSPYPYIPGTYTYANFGHLEGYSSMYYTYMWSLVMAKDLLTKFESAGLMDKPTAIAYRKAVLEPGGTVDAQDMVKNFLGREYSFNAFQHWLSATH